MKIKALANKHGVGPLAMQLGVSKQTIYNWISGKGVPHKRLALRVNALAQEETSLPGRPSEEWRRYADWAGEAAKIGFRTALECHKLKLDKYKDFLLRHIEALEKLAEKETR